MYWIGRATITIGIALQVSILVLMTRRGLMRLFPLFFSYVLYEALIGIVESLILSHARLYSYFYWTAAVGEIILTILAAHESFRRVFRAFYLLPWFRLLFPLGIVLALLYSALSGYLSPPVDSRVRAAIISAMLTAQYVILTISIGFFILARFLHVPWRIHEYRFMLGFGVSALLTVLGVSLRSEFGTRYELLYETLPALASLLALAIWLSAVVHPYPPGLEATDQPLSPDEVVTQLRRQFAIIRSLFRRS
jgi:hypothetical protein